jgi:hypothetical protein
MRVVRRIPFATALVALAGLVLATRGQKAQPTSEQSSFAEDQPLQNPVTVSPDVLRGLLETEEAKQGLEFANESQRDHPAQLFRAAEVHLSRQDGVDLVVVGVCPMCGADNGWFWVVRSARKDPEVVLFAGGNSVELMTGRTNGYRDIRSTWSSPSETHTTIYHFDGKRYKVWKEKWTENRK